MKVEHIIEVLSALDKNDQVMINFFIKEDGDERAETTLTDMEWTSAVTYFERSNWLDQVNCEVFAEVIDKVLNERVKENVGNSANVS